MTAYQVGVTTDLRNEGTSGPAPSAASASRFPRARPTGGRPEPGPGRDTSSAPDEDVLVPRGSCLPLARRALREADGAVDHSTKQDNPEDHHEGHPDPIPSVHPMHGTPPFCFGVSVRVRGPGAIRPWPHTG